MTPKILNTIENAGVAIVTLLVINFIIVRPLRNEITTMREAIVEIAKQPKYSINNDFEKMRTKKNGSITFDLNNELNHMELQAMDTMVIDTTAEISFFKRLFKKNK